MLFRSIIALAASAALASAIGPLPTDIAFLVNQVADLMVDTPFYAQISQAVDSLVAANGLPSQQAVDGNIYSSLLLALNSQNVPTAATGIAGSIVSQLLDDPPPAKVTSLVSSIVSEIKNPAINTQIASIVDELVGFLIQLRVEAPEMFDDSPETTATSTSTLSNTGTTVTTPTSTNSSTKSSATSSVTSKPLNDSTTSDSDSDSNVSSHESSSKTNAAQATKQLLGIMSVGVAAGAVVASFF
ncbi:hypothetical protein IWW38_001829 [Coemansia aciculifera]|uniref:Uncharacterized protein n=1 Tax=Coemansia aciculifera TaxID=417176 RepID=A0ACC1M5X2_9FUNG|nr:hypothetical protein IWW38_001829 [Coemansia aciculifera]